MSQVINDLLNPWMRELHGDEHPDAVMLRLATLVFCASLPKTVSASLSEYKTGTACVTVNLMPHAQEQAPNDVSTDTLVDRLMCGNHGALIQRIYIPKQFVFSTHVAGAAILKNLVLKEFSCEMTVMAKGGALHIELYHRNHKRWVIFSLSAQ